MSSLAAVLVLRMGMSKRESTHWKLLDKRIQRLSLPRRLLTRIAVSSAVFNYYSYAGISLLIVGPAALQFCYVGVLLEAGNRAFARTRYNLTGEGGAEDYLLACCCFPCDSKDVAAESLVHD